MGQIRVDAQNVYQNTIKNDTKEQNKVFGKKKEDNMTKPKITNKDRDQQTAFLTQQLARCFNLIGAYIEFKGDDADFKKFLIDFRSFCQILHFFSRSSVNFSKLRFFFVLYIYKNGI